MCTPANAIADFTKGERMDPAISRQHDGQRSDCKTPKATRPIVSALCGAGLGLVFLSLVVQGQADQVRRLRFTHDGMVDREGTVATAAC